jgi:alpha-mannosidase
MRSFVTGALSHLVSLGLLLVIMHARPTHGANNVPTDPSPTSAGLVRPDLSRDKVLYCVGYAHLDTQWRWDFPITIDRYIRDTLIENFARFEKYPEYVFNFTGSVRYEMMREYYPREYARLKEYIAAGRWQVSGSSVDEGDVNVVAPEAVIRQMLYGNQFFAANEFGSTPSES